MSSTMRHVGWAFVIAHLGCGAGDAQPAHVASSTPIETTAHPGSVAIPSSVSTPTAVATPTARGTRECPVFDARVSVATADWSPWSGCKCTPDGTARIRDRERCGMFPCAEQGCYVQRCKADSDCTSGICANYLGSPRGYCVTDDPK